MLKHAVRNRILYLINQLHNNCIFKCIVCCILCIFFQLLADIGLQFIYSIKLRSILNEFIVQFRQFFLRNAVDMALENSFLACIIFHLIIFRELYSYIEIFVNLVTCNLVFKARDELAAAQLELIIFALAAFECFITEETFKVQIYFIAHFSCAVINGNNTRISLAHCFNLLINFFICYIFLNPRSFNALIISNTDFRLCYADHLQGNAVFLADGSYFNLRGIYNIQISLNQDSRKFKVQNCIDCIFVENIFAISSLTKLSRHLTLPETRQGDIFLLALISSFYSFFKAFCINFHNQFGHVYISFGR